MGEPGLNPGPVMLSAGSELELKSLAAALARGWRARTARPLLIGLQGDLGAGKTTWVRGMLEGLGHTGRVPSPTYTLLEHYALTGLDVIHVDLYRLGGSGGDADARGELETLGLRDWLARERCWVVVEWPERSADLARRCDLIIGITTTDDAAARGLSFDARSDAGAEVLRGLEEISDFASS
jgi:tRNA threonylcarbamoyladenosine biosynthesis protein TsaE